VNSLYSIVSIYWVVSWYCSCCITYTEIEWILLFL
jgi:hypothetical protein